MGTDFWFLGLSTPNIRLLTFKINKNLILFCSEHGQVFYLCTKFREEMTLMFFSAQKETNLQLQKPCIVTSLSIRFCDYPYRRSRKSFRHEILYMSSILGRVGHNFFYNFLMFLHLKINKFKWVAPRPIFI